MSGSVDPLAGGVSSASEAFVDLWFALQASGHPGRIAIEHNSGTLTYGDLQALMESVAWSLQARDLDRDAIVGLFMPPSPEFVAGLLGALHAGLTYTVLDIGWPPRRMLSIVSEAAIACVVTTREHRAALRGVCPDVLCIDDLACKARGAVSTRHRTPDSLAYVAYTSGSTGRPKGVMVTHRGLHNYTKFAAAAYYRDAAAPAPIVGSVATDLVLTSILPPLVCGAGLLILPEADPVVALAELIRHGRELGVVKLTPSHLRSLESSLAGVDRTRIQLLVVGGEQLHRARLEFWLSRGTGSIINEYGPTETTVGCTWHEVSARSGEATVPIGQPLPGMTAHILDAELQPVARGRIGELFIGGAGLARGYFAAPAATAAHFVPDPTSGAEPGARLYRTGDLGYVDESGELVFAGRADRQLKIRGFRVEPEEVEAALRAHPDVEEAAVLPHKEGDVEGLVAFVSPTPGVQVDVDALRGFVAARLPRHLVPYRLEPVDAFPLTAAGKLDLTALASRPPRPTVPGTLAVGDAQRDVAQVWADVLGLDEPPLDATFFSLGGDSILAIQIAIRLRGRGYLMEPRQLFETQTIRELSAAIAPAVEAGASTPAPTSGAPELTPIQRWFFEQRFADWRYWNHALRKPLPPGATFEMVERAVREVLGAHEIFAWRFKYDGERVAVERESPRLDVTTCVELEPGTAASEAIRTVARAQQSRIDPASGHLIDVVFAASASGPPLLSIVAHHLAVDVVSWQILSAEFDTLLHAALGGKRAVLSRETPFSARSVALSRLASERASEADYWAALAASAEPPAIETEPALEETTHLRTAFVSPEVTAALRRKCDRMLRAPLTDITLAVILLALRDELKRNRIQVDLENPGRAPVKDLGAVDSTVGWLAAVYPAAFNVGGARDAIDAVTRVRQAVTAVPGAGLGYGLLRYLSPDPGVRAQMAAIPPSPIRYNHLGNVGLDALAGPDGEVDRGGGNHRPYLLEFDTWIRQGGLAIRVSYSRQEFEREAVDRLIDRVTNAIDAFVAEPDAPCGRAQLLTLQSLDVEDRYPLSPLQRGILLDEERDAGAGIYFVQLSAILHGPLDAAAFAGAWQQVVDDTPVLRTSFTRSETGEPLQRVHATATLPVAVEDWTGRDPRQLGHDMDRYLAEQRGNPFDLAKPPLMRVHLVRLDAQRWWFVWSHHHIILDGWSLAPLLRDVLDAYVRNTTGRAAARPPSGSYGEYITWLSRLDLRAAETFWRRRLAGLETLPPLAMIRGVETARTDGDDPYARVETVIGAADVAALRACVRDRGVTLNTLFQAAWSLVLSRLARTDDAVFGAVVSGRPAELSAVEQLPGLFINTIPVRIQIDGARSVLEWLRNIEAAQRETEPFQYCSLADLQAWAGLIAPAQLFESVLVFENYPGPESVWRQLPGLTVSDVRSYERTTFPMTIGIHLTDGIRITLTYARVRFDESSCCALAAALVTTVTALAAGAGGRLCDLPVALPGGARQMTDVSAVADISDAIAARVALQPDAAALLTATGTLTFLDLWREAGRIGRGFSDHGLRPGGRVLFVDEPGALEVAALLGAARSSAAFSVLRADAPRSQLADAFDFYRPDIAVLPDDLMDRAPVAAFLRDRKASTAVLSWSVVAGFPAAGDLDPANDVPAGYAPDARDEFIAYVAFTSGTTGQPKGIAQSRRAVSAFVAWFTRAFDLGPGKRFAQWAPLSYDAGYIEVLAALAGGATLCLLSADEKCVPSRLLNTLANHRITHLQTTPSMMTQVLGEFARSANRGTLASLEHVLLAGEALSPSLVGELQAALSRRASIVNLYGPAETILATWHRVAAPVPATDRTVPIGTPIPRRSVMIADHHLRPLAAGIVGEIVIESPDIAAASDGHRAYRSGDLGRDLGFGVFEFVGRLDTQIKLRGMRLEVESVEAVLRRHRRVTEALVAAVAHGAGDLRLTAWVVLKAAGEALPYAEMRRHARRFLPEAFVPSVLHTVASLPRTWNGKLDRTARIEVPGSVEAAPRTAATPIEQSLLIIWRLLLQGDVTSIDDSFLEHGGHSLLAAQFLSRVERVFGVQLSLDQFFESPTIRFVAGVVAASEDGSRHAELFLRNWDLVSGQAPSASGADSAAAASE